MLSYSHQTKGEKRTMKKKSIVIALSILILLATVISSCTASLPSINESESSATDTSDQKRIEELEAKILALIQSQQLSDEERKKQIELLSKEIERLKDASESVGQQKPDDTTAVQPYIYKVENGCAIITEINTDEESLTVPSVIDGYRVISIGTQALRSTSVKSIIISSGIEKLDWFAFSGCIALSSISIPDSVTSIGYGAFDNTAKSFTVYCSRDSFAHKYAQSYGITYGIT